MLHIDSISGGKSAVLSAITVALGGKATATGRGNGLKSFIREGQKYVALDSALNTTWPWAYLCPQRF